MSKELITFNEELYWVYRKVKSEFVKDSTSLKDFWMCDITLRQGEWLWFCRHIPEAIIEVD